MLPQAESKFSQNYLVNGHYLHNEIICSSDNGATMMLGLLVIFVKNVITERDFHSVLAVVGAVW